MSKTISLQYALSVANGDRPPASPLEEAQIIDTLFEERLRALDSSNNIPAYVSYQLRDAMEDMLRAQDFTPAFKKLMAATGEKLSGAHEPDIQRSALLPYLAHWADLSKKQRLHAMGMLTDYMNDLFKAELPAKDPFRIVCRKFMPCPPAMELDFVTGDYTPAQRAVDKFTTGEHDTTYQLRANEHVIMKQDASRVMGSVFSAGITAFSLHLARQKKLGQETPSALREDVERLAAYQLYRIFEYAVTFPKNTTFIERVAQARGDKMASKMKDVIERHAHSVAPPARKPDNFIGRMTHALGLGLQA